VRDNARVLRIDLASIRAAEYHRRGLLLRCRECGAGTIVAARTP
jgi:hypothetical protein